MGAELLEIKLDTEVVALMPASYYKWLQALIAMSFLFVTRTKKLTNLWACWQEPVAPNLKSFCYFAWVPELLVSILT